MKNIFFIYDRLRKSSKVKVYLRCDFIFICSTVRLEILHLHITARMKLVAIAKYFKYEIFNNIYDCNFKLFQGLNRLLHPN